MHVNHFFCLWTKVHQLFSPNVGWMVVDELLFSIFDLWIHSGDIRDQIRSCQKLRRISNVFSSFQILGGRPSKNSTNVITPGSRHVVWINICHDIPISYEVIDVHTLEF